MAAVDFGRRLAQAGFMIITGAANGIMEAGHIGAGRENSIGGSCFWLKSSRTLVPDRMTRSASVCGQVFCEAIPSQALQ